MRFEKSGSFGICSADCSAKNARESSLRKHLATSKLLAEDFSTESRSNVPRSLAGKPENLLKRKVKILVF